MSYQQALLLQKAHFRHWRVKIYLRIVMNASRLNHLMILREHKHKTDELDLNKIAEEFVVRNDRRKYSFGSTQ